MPDALRVLAGWTTAAVLCGTGCASSTNEPRASESPPTSTPTPAASAPAIASPPPGTVVFHAYGVELGASAEEGSRVIRIFPDATGSLTVTLRGTDGAIRVCALAQDRDSAPSACLTPADRAPVSLAGAGVEVRRPAGRHYIDEVAVAYRPASRRVLVRAPHIVPKPGQSVCKDNGCNPFYELTPHRAGTLTARATWEGRATGKLLIQVGRVAERSWSATGRPYDVPVQSTAEDGTVRVSTTTKSGEVAVALENEGTRLLRAPTIEFTWP